jgi:hypothetical protein
VLFAAREYARTCGLLHRSLRRATSFKLGMEGRRATKCASIYVFLCLRQSRRMNLNLSQTCTAWRTKGVPASDAPCEHERERRVGVRVPMHSCDKVSGWTFANQGVEQVRRQQSDGSTGGCRRVHMARTSGETQSASQEMLSREHDTPDSNSACALFLLYALCAACLPVVSNECFL